MRPTVTIPDLSEKGRNAAGETISLDRRLFMQVLAWTGCHDHGELAAPRTYGVNLKFDF